MSVFTYPEEVLVQSAIITPDGTRLVSKHRHDFVSYRESNGDRYFIDGGLTYKRIGGNIDAVRDDSIVTDDHFLARELLVWGTYGKDGNEELRYVPVCDLTIAHIHNILETQKTILPQMKLCLTYELLYRAFNDSGWKSDLYDDDYDDGVVYDE